MKWIVLLAVAILGNGCKKPALPAPSTAIKKYDQNRDKTTVSSPDLLRSIDGRDVTVSTYYTYAGTVPASKPKEFMVLVTSKPTGKGVESDDIPITIQVENENLFSGRTAFTTASNGKRSYVIDLSPTEFSKFINGTSAQIEVNDIVVPLSQADISELRKVAEME